MFSPSRSRCPVILSELSTARKTIMVNENDEEKVDFTANWKVLIEAHKATPESWTGRTIFYRRSPRLFAWMKTQISKMKKKRHAPWFMRPDMEL